MSFDEKTLRSLIPDSTFSTGGSVTDFEEVERKAKLLVNRLSSPPEIPTVPSASLVGVLRKLIPRIPTVTVPSRAELERYVSETIERIKKEQQERILLRLLADELTEQTPFTARRNFINKFSRITRR